MNANPKSIANFILERFFPKVRSSSGLLPPKQTSSNAKNARFRPRKHRCVGDFEGFQRDRKSGDDIPLQNIFFLPARVTFKFGLGEQGCCVYYGCNAGRTIVRPTRPHIRVDYALDKPKNIVPPEARQTHPQNPQTQETTRLNR
jgi:hypothetical protein